MNKLETCANPYCDCAPNDCMNHKVDTRGYWSLLKEQNMNPAYISYDFQEHYAGGFATSPTEVTCTLIYNDPVANYNLVAEATSSTAHKAKMQAYKQLELMYQAQQTLTPQHYVPDNKTVELALDQARLQALKRDTQQTTATALNKAIKAMDQQYLLDKLQEEAAEIIQAVSKIRRFGPNNHHPDRTQTNLQELAGELEDFQAIVWALEEIQYLDPKPSITTTIKKYQALTSS